MPLIDELKHQAEHVIRNNEQTIGFSEALLESRRSEVVCSLNRINEYLNSLIEQLHIINPTILTQLELDDTNQITQVQLKKFRQFYEHTFHELSLGITCRMECDHNSVVVSTNKQNDTQGLISKLQQLGLDVYADEHNQVRVEGRFSASLLFRSNFNEYLIIFTISNIETTRTMQFKLQPESITEDFLNEMGNYLLRKDNQFIQQIKQYQVNEPHTANNGTEESTLTELVLPPYLYHLSPVRKQLFLTYRETLKEITSGNDGIVIGRGTHCDLTIPSDLASREHARIVFRRGRFVISDSSTNGTYIKIQGSKEVYIHGEDYPLSGSGFISLGNSATIDNDHLIYFSCP